MDRTNASAIVVVMRKCHVLDGLEVDISQDRMEFL